MPSLLATLTELERRVYEGHCDAETRRLVAEAKEMVVGVQRWVSAAAKYHGCGDLRVIEVGPCIDEALAIIREVQDAGKTA